MPVASSLQKMLGAPALLLPMGQVSRRGRFQLAGAWSPGAASALPSHPTSPPPPCLPCPSRPRQASDCPHLANERIRRLNLLRGKNVVKNLLVEVGRAAATQQQQQANGGVAGK
jgi:hypothetical protein